MPLVITVGLAPQVLASEVCSFRTGAALITDRYTAGIPTIVKPFFGDQFFWADRVEALGIGSAVRKLTVQSMADALVAATTDQKQIQRAKEIGEQIRAVSLYSAVCPPDTDGFHYLQENGVATAIEAIYRDLEYARSLIKGAALNEDAEHATIRQRQDGPSSPGCKSARSSASSARGGATSDWSVISDQED